MSEDRFDTAHERWDRWWGDAKQRVHWSEPEPVVVELIPALVARGATRVLDVGAGIGRHALAYARAGLEVVAVDASRTGLDELARSAARNNLRIDARVAPFTALPVEDATVDHVLAWNVLYHGDGDIVTQALQECRRVLRHGGTFQATMLSKRNRAYGVGRQVRPNTFVDQASTGDRDHPHYYADAAELCALLVHAGFEPTSIVDRDQRPPGEWHWTVSAEIASPLRPSRKPDDHEG